jgi:SAM-dependent methyltransferase
VRPPTGGFRILARVNSASQSPPTDRKSSSFGADRLALIAELEGSHFWFAGRRALVRRLLDRHVGGRVASALDVGCGTGAFLPILEQYADRVVGLDPLGAGDSRILAGEAERLPFEAASFDLAVALDVLEHVDDGAAVGELARVVRPGGRVVVTVPAFPILWSARDALAAHRRRYRRAPFVKLFESNGLAVLETAYYQFLLFPLVLASRAAGRLQPRTAQLEEQPRPRVNGVLRRVSELEVRMGSRIPWPWGSTLAVAARRQT